MTAEGPALEELCRIADGLRRDVVGDEVTYVVNRNINFTNVCYTGCRFCAFAQRRTDADAYSLSLDQVADRAEEAWELGATEVCMQGGIDPELPGTAYFDLAAAVKARVPGMHVHAFSPMEVVNGASRTGLSIHDWLARAQDAGLDTIPGHGRGDPRRRRPLGPHQGQAAHQRLGRGDHHRAPARHPVVLDDDVRPRRQPPALGAAPARASPGSRTPPARPGSRGSPSSCRCRSCTPARRSTSPASPAPAPPCATTSPCTRWPGSCCTAGSTTSRPRGSSSASTAPARCCGPAPTTSAAP